MKTTTVIITAILAGAVSASAQNMFEAILEPGNEIPPHNTPAYGEAYLTLTGMTLSINAGTGTYSDLLGGATQVSLNDAGAGTNGATIFTFTLDTPGETSGTFEGNGTLTASQVTDLNSGYIYINVKDSVYPSGELRGQLIAVPEPSTLALASAGVLALLAGRRKGRRSMAEKISASPAAWRRPCHQRSGSHPPCPR